MPALPHSPKALLRHTERRVLPQYRRQGPQHEVPVVPNELRRRRLPGRHDVGAEDVQPGPGERLRAVPRWTNINCSGILKVHFLHCRKSPERTRKDDLSPLSGGDIFRLCRIQLLYEMRIRKILSRNWRELTLRLPILRHREIRGNTR